MLQEMVEAVDQELREGKEETGRLVRKVILIFKNSPKVYFIEKFERVS